MIRDCKVCGASYKTCYACERERSWRLHTDTLDHYYIFSVIMSYQVNHDAKRAYNVLQKRGIDFRNTAGFTPSIREALAEIYALAHENNRAKKAAAKTGTARTGETGNGKAAEQRE